MIYSGTRIGHHTAHNAGMHFAMEWIEAKSPWSLQIKTLPLRITAKTLNIDVPRPRLRNFTFAIISAVTKSVVWQWDSHLLFVYLRDFSSRDCSLLRVLGWSFPFRSNTLLNFPSILTVNLDEKFNSSACMLSDSHEASFSFVYVSFPTRVPHL
jgi:hypothetical protein